ncbi:FecCD family ABC transporter permease [Brevibacillus parabrevis]|uniref:Iron ABC transporter permease n=1 Tax=Brevibacillus parabrevis TaxID=54914 RepID=A0A4Y3PLX2_BREPA|nr:iron ABC transporter permease [Brevibacillus parabrevis]RNB97428.1 iron ABC transporter permease [Brevibacillus parabrevis]GEB34317.1 iron ABC transporter permease [Brevibacillus parabrevis]
MTRHQRMIVVMAASLALLVCMAGLTLGSTLLSPLEVIAELFGLGDGENAYIVMTLRLPRVLLSFLAGAALGISGLILQSVIRNPLASPDIIGITNGAAVAATLYTALLMGKWGVAGLPFAAMLGAGTVSLLIYLLSWNKGVTPIRLVLIGIGMAAAAGAVTTMMTVLSPTMVASQAYIWIIGTVYAANYAEVGAMLVVIGVLVPLTLILTRPAHVQELGDDVATGLGDAVQRHRTLFIVISVALAGSAVAYAGTIGFVGLVAPHIARTLIGRSFYLLVPVAGLLGGFLVCAADVIGRTLFLPYDMPAGIFTAAIGAPFFIYLLYRNRNL